MKWTKKPLNVIDSRLPNLIKCSHQLGTLIDDVPKRYATPPKKKILKKESTLLYTVKAYDEAKEFAKSQFHPYLYQRLELNKHRKYSFKCSELKIFRNYFCIDENDGINGEKLISNYMTSISSMYIFSSCFLFTYKFYYSFRTLFFVL